jgi:hypothetical protein
MAVCIYWKDASDAEIRQMLKDVVSDYERALGGDLTERAFKDRSDPGRKFGDDPKRPRKRTRK